MNTIITTVKHKLYDNKSFTLVELLIVIAIIGVLVTIVVLVFDPMEYIKQARDSKRFQDVGSVLQALKIVEVQVPPPINGGSSTVVYLSLIDTTGSSTCGQYSDTLPSLPTGYTYHCPTSTADATRIDGFGWIPVNFSASSVGSLTKLPLDPENNASTLTYYTYIPSAGQTLSGTALTSAVESKKYIQKASDDSGYFPERYEAGSDMSLNKNIAGLKGYWPLDGTTKDMSGNNITAGAWTGTATYATGVKGQAASFNGSSYITVPVTTLGFGQMTLSAWVKPVARNSNQGIVGTLPYYNSAYGLILQDVDDRETAFLYNLWEKPSVYFTTLVKINQRGVLTYGAWNHIVGVWRETSAYASGTPELYLNGEKIGSPQSTSDNNREHALTGITMGRYIDISDITYYLNGLVDDVRIYNRPLSQAEIQTIYTMTK